MTLDDVQAALRTWGAWQRGAGGVIPGIVSHAYDEGEVTDRRLVDRIEGSHPEAERTDRALCQLKRVHANAYQTVHLYYVCELSIRDMAERLHIGRTVVNELKNTAEHMLLAIMACSVAA